ncbi:MAG: AAA-like domain-containing protein [Treponema sp.]|nr:AAA-like domain-containing protein [Treponema sp.]
MKKFNVTGTCIPSENYMVDISGKLEKIMKLIDDGCYFTINRARQYGKTTTLSRIHNTLPAEYICARISFEGLCDESFASQEKFCPTFIERIYTMLQFSSAEEEYREKWLDESITDFKKLSRHITKMCEGKKVVLIIDEVDRTSHNRVFLGFIAMLREKFLLRREGMDYTFHSVILAGVYDIKNIKLKLVSEGNYVPAETENKTYNSPWNIAVDFDIDMSFNPTEISTMLKEYEAENNTGMYITVIAEEIYKYTSGYPFLVSRICQHIDKKFEKNWTTAGVLEAVKVILLEANTLFDDVFKNLENNKELHDFIYSLLIVGETGNFVIDDPIISIGLMYGFLKKIGDRVAISNKIFETRISNYFISKDNRKRKQSDTTLQRDIVKDGRFDIELCLRKFADHYAEIFNDNDRKFLERHGRLIFLSYLRPLINGQGFYHIESQFTDLRRMDIVVDFGREQFIIELKLWKGDEAEKKSYSQLLGYMETKKAESGYLLIFDFRKEKNKQPKAEWVDVDGKRIFEVIV